jgi:hypothetical protein
MGNPRFGGNNRGMKKWLRVTLSIFIIATVVALTWRLRLPPDPIYKGRKLSAWLGEYKLGLDSPSPRNMRPEREKADEAVYNAGTNAFPVLLRMLWHRDSALKTKLAAWTERHHFTKIHFTMAAVVNWQAVMGFKALGDRGANAVPVLAAGLTNADWTARMNAAKALSAVIAKPEIAVPALVGSLQDTNWMVQVESLTALQRYGKAAKTAVPALLKLLSADQVGVQEGAGRALWAIDPDAATKANIR